MNTNTHNDMNRDQIEMGKLVAEMMNLLADTRKKEDEREKLRAETLKINAETKWHSFYKVAMWWGSAFAAAAAVIKFSNVFLK